MRTDSRLPSKQRLKLWIRLLGMTRATQNHLREFLRLNHATTLPRFDVMAALYRRREGVMMSELSRLLLVSNGNATAIVDRLEADGLVKRKASDADRRSVRVALTPLGLKQFDTLAAEHEGEINRLFAELSEAEVETLASILKRIGKGGRT
jgi:DNA-binding MarR family transcriptional regulator